MRPLALNRQKPLRSLPKPQQAEPGRDRAGLLRSGRRGSILKCEQRKRRLRIGNRRDRGRDEHCRRRFDRAYIKPFASSPHPPQRGVRSCLKSRQDSLRARLTAKADADAPVVLHPNAADIAGARLQRWRQR